MVKDNMDLRHILKNIDFEIHQVNLEHDGNWSSNYEN